jgi:hypothetical protein
MRRDKITKININNVNKIDKVVGGDYLNEPGEGKDVLKPSTVAAWVTVVVGVITILGSCSNLGNSVNNTDVDLNKNEVKSF